METLSLYEQTPGKESVLYLTGLNNLATVDYLKGDYGRAEERFAEALAIIERVLGTDHPDWASDQNLERTRNLSAGARERRSRA